MIRPNHVAIIMDGNGRWGIKNFNNRAKGHEYGVKNIKPIIEFCIRNKIKNLTLYALSKDNFLKRKKKELKNIFYLFEKYLNEQKTFFEKKKINLFFIGENTGLPINIKKIMSSINKKSDIKNINLNLSIAFNYSSKLEIIKSFKKTLSQNKSFNTKNIQKNLFTGKINDPEIIIRTGGMNRLSDFLLWQSAYSEIYFVKTLWPDFTVRKLNNILTQFNTIKRNFGA